MEIKHIQRGDRGAFVIGDGSIRVAEMTYVNAGENGINIDHTEVDESLRGQDIGEKLLAEAVKYAREKGMKIHATCDYALKKLQEDATYADVFAG